MVTTHSCKRCIWNLGPELVLKFNGCVRSCWSKVLQVVPQNPERVQALPRLEPLPPDEEELSNCAEEMGQALSSVPVRTSGVAQPGKILHAETMDYIPAKSACGTVVADSTGQLLGDVSITVKYQGRTCGTARSQEVGFGDGRSRLTNYVPCLQGSWCPDTSLRNYKK